MLHMTPDQALSAYVTSLIMATAGFAALLGLILFGESHAGQQMWRRYLLQHHVPARLKQMLRSRKVDIDRYLATVSASDIRLHAQNCRGCTRQLLCDDVLAGEPSKAVDYSFCPNARTISALRESGSP